MFYLACLSDWPAWMSVHQCAGLVPSGGVGFPGTGAEGHQVRARDQTQVLNHRAISLPV